MARLQGEKWYNFRREHKLKLLCISISSNGNYRADVKDEKGRHWYHWLHPIEVENLKKSGWLENHITLDSNSLYNNTEIKNKLKRGEPLYG